MGTGLLRKTCIICVCVFACFMCVCVCRTPPHQQSHHQATSPCVNVITRSACRGVSTNRSLTISFSFIFLIRVSSSLFLTHSSGPPDLSITSPPLSLSTQCRAPTRGRSIVGSRCCSTRTERSSLLIHHAPLSTPSSGLNCFLIHLHNLLSARCR